MGMESMGGSITPAEAVLLNGQNRNDGMFSGNGEWVFFLFFLLAWGNGGFGGFGHANGATNFINNDFLYTNLKNTMDTGFSQIAQQQFATQKDIWQTGSNLGQQMCTGFHSVDSELCSGFNATQRELMENRFASQQCCCETNRNIDAVRYENAKNTCDIINAIRTDGEATRAQITANTIQDLRDRLEARDRDLMTANFQLSQQAQSANLIQELRPCPVPAYPSCSPYQVFNGWGNCGCGC